MLSRRSLLLNRKSHAFLKLRTCPRFNTSKQGQIHSNNAESAPITHSRLDRTINRLPKFLQSYLRPVRNAPLSHITSFLVLHEITAVVPLLGLWASFHYTQWLPPYFSEGKWVHEGVERFGKYFRRKGWFGFGKDKTEEQLGDEAIKGKISKTELWYNRGSGGVRILIEAATAWAVTKALLPFRIIASVWATPWFARVAVVPVTGRFWRIIGRRRK